MSEVAIPHFSFPFRIMGAAAVVTEQDSDDEIADCVRVILSYAQGSRLELPEFGLPDPTFEQGGPTAAEVQQVVDRWEPRARRVPIAEILVSQPPSTTGK